MKKEVQNNTTASFRRDRREFLKLGGLAIAGAGLLLTGCEDDDNDFISPPATYLPGMRDGVFDFGNNDLGILTYAYALEQLEAEFSTRVVTAAGFSTAFPTTQEQEMMMEIYQHEVIHREFFRNLLTNLLPDPATQLLPDLEFDFGSLDFSNRTAVLATAAYLEDTGIAAYNGAGRYIRNEENLVTAGKIVSVEGRHAAAIRSLMTPDSPNFAPNPLDAVLRPSQVIADINSRNYITTAFSATYLP